jgi:ADP-heptose:LPS heptosyltransferase
MFTDLILPPNPPLPHQLDHYQSLLDAYNIVPTHRFPEIHISDTVMEQTVSLLKNQGISSSEPFIALQPFSLWSYKEWKTANYVELVRQIQADYDVSIVITGIPSERDRAQRIIYQCGGSRIYNLAGQTSLRHFSALLKCCKLFIGVDSAGGHIAAAVGTPCVIIFGPGLPSVWAPLGERSHIVRKDMPCVPCGLKGCQSSDVSLCLDTLTAEEVMLVVRRQLDSGNIGSA